MNEIKQIDCGDGKIDFLPIYGGGIINTVENGVANTIKANYYKTSFANLIRSGSFGATGVIEKAKMAGDRMTESKSNEIIVIGKMDHTMDNTHESANRVYSKDGICPTIPTCAGGNIQPKIIDDTEEKHQSVIIDDIYKNRKARVYKGVGPTLRSQNNELKTIVAMRGRNPENPSDRTAGAKTEQRLEPNGEGVCNTLTSVQKDNLLLEAKPECINLYDEQGKETAFQDRVYKTDKISPEITTSFRPNYAVEHKETDSEKIKIKQATKQGFIECKAGGVADFSYPDSKLRRGRVQGGGDVSPTLTSSNLGVCKVESRYRIRKFTPRECWRLMGFFDADFEKAQAVNSNTQLYKQAGNSIVKNVLMAIFGQMVEQEK